MTEVNTTPQAPAPDPEAMKALLAKLAKIQKILGNLSFGQAILGLLFLAAPFMPANLVGDKIPGTSYLLLAPFLFGLSYATSFAKKDITFAKVAFRNTAISQLGLAVVSLGLFFLYPGTILLACTAGIALLLGGLAAMVIYQASKG